MRELLPFVLGLAVLSVGCADDEVGTDTPSDSAVASDTGKPDSSPIDSGGDSGGDSGVDATTDSSSADSSLADSGKDSGATDTGAADTGPADTGPADTGAGAADVGTMSFMTDIQPIFTTNCTGCHSGSAASAGMSLTSAYPVLVGVASNCDATVKRVQPGSTTGSMLWRKLANDPAKCGSAMPFGTAGLKTTDPTAFAKIEAWIAQGALNN